MIDYAGEKGIVLLVETSGIFCDTSKLRDMLDSFASDTLAALWDMYSPYFIGNEEPETTIKNLGAYIKHVHIKDAQKLLDAYNELQSEFTFEKYLLLFHCCAVSALARFLYDLCRDLPPVAALALSGSMFALSAATGRNVRQYGKSV